MNRRRHLARRAPRAAANASQRAPLLHPPEDLLLDYVCGAADLPQRVLLEAHLARCPTCADLLGDLAGPGGAALAQATSGDAPPPAGGWNRLWSAIERGDAGAPPPGAIPAAAWGELPPRRRSVRWRPLSVLGAHFAPLARDPVSGTFVSVARMSGGRRFPRHRHVGPEDVVVLQGAFGDHVGDFAPGDWASYADGSEHEPLTVAGPDCWILTRLHHPVRFFGWRGILQRLLGV